MNELETKYTEKFKDTPFKVLNIHGINHKPHPYTIGPGHVGWASDHFGGMLGKEAIHDFEKHGKGHCAVPNCKIPYDEHTYDFVLFLQLKRNVSKEEARKDLNYFSDSLKEDEIDGIVFVETDEKYRIS